MHFDEFDAKYDEWLPIATDRLRERDGADRASEPARAALLRRPIQRWFLGPKRWFVGRVTRYEEQTGKEPKYTVEYEDGEERREPLPLTNWSFDLLDL